MAESRSARRKRRISRRSAGMMIGACGVGAALFAGLLVFHGTDDTLRTGEESEWIDQLVDPLDGDEDPTGSLDKPHYSSTFGGPGPAHTLVLYDNDGSDLAAQQEMDGLAAANLATHFGQVTLAEINDYSAGDMESYDGVVYSSSSYSQEIPEPFIDDVLEQRAEVIWPGPISTSSLGERGAKKPSSSYRPTAGTLVHHSPISRIG